jgi:hypothetical protein
MAMAMRSRASSWVALTIALVVAVLLAVLATTPPRPAPLDAPATDFSAMRAIQDVRAIARAPHPTGSAENERVHAFLAARLTQMGMEVRVLPSTLSAEGKKKLDRWRGRPAPAPIVRSLLGIMPGRDRQAPAILLMAHFDSVWGSPGAADDASGVAAALEVARAIRASGVPPRDLMLLLTDGEEVGLEGARAFFGGNPLNARVGTVINLEARGAGGRAAMFETGPGNDRAMRLFGDAVRGPVATSLSVFIYEHLPNSTDFTPAKKGGWPGYNFAFIGRAAYYHSPLSTPDVVDRGGVQDMGGQALDLVRGLYAAPPLTRGGGERTFFDAFGLTLIGYAPWLGWLWLAIGLTGYAVSLRHGAAGLGRGVIASLALVVGAGVLLTLLNLLSGADGPVNYYDRLAAIPRLQVQALLACVATVAVSIGLVPPRQAEDRGFAAGLAVPVALSAVVAQAAAPTASYPLVVSLMLTGLAAASGWRSAMMAAAAVVIGYMLGFGFFLMQAVGPTTPVAAVLPLLVAAMSLAPLCPPVPRRAALALAAAALALGAGVALWVRLDPIAPSVAVYSNDK